MKRFQRTLTATVAAAALAGTFALSANAQTAQPAVSAPAHSAVQHSPRHTAPDFAKFHAERTERMKTLLQIQPNQQAAWDKYAKAITPEPRTKAHGERADLRKLTTPERLDLAQKLRKERSAKAEQRDQATRSFYSSLNPSQQKAFDELTARHPGKHHAGSGAKRMDGKRGHHGHGPAGHAPVTASPAA
ncbi:Spy/CpxP family protein refolding chaperone [Comamonas sp. CMM02]|jgi:protein CpxP|uniref:Spy/CpxP family protein refolding chaperone n=1 Tax=Comamonas sp. CMM02 TaxID=2769307 RepID=UPI0017824A14|nr:Spy/CpxP family protein refolding chaperone [Comamonas sp. CMM02]MBD9403015.1 Spy/CpxP family protein refolding chaperone [Comamonas sp. CMM02]